MQNQTNFNFTEKLRAMLAFVPAMVAGLVLIVCLPSYAGEKISIDTVSGNLMVQQKNGEWSPVLPNKIKLPIALKTGPGGKAEIKQGDTVISMNPGTELELDKSTQRGPSLISIVKQKIGNAIYKIEKHPGEFRVETPYLVSVVKGTRFSVFTDNTNSFVSVTEGLVEVNDLRTGEIQDLAPGGIARSISSTAANANTSQAKSLIIQNARSVDASIAETPDALASTDGGSTQGSAIRNVNSVALESISNEDNIRGKVEIEANLEANLTDARITAFADGVTDSTQILEEAIIDEGADPTEDEGLSRLLQIVCSAASAIGIENAAPGSLLSYCP